MTEGKHPGVSVVDLYINAATVSFFDDDPRIRIEFSLRPRPKEQRLINAVLALDGEGRQVAKTELGVKTFRLVVVVQHGQVQVAEPTAHEVLDQMPHQYFADAGPRAVWVNRQAPEAAAVFRIVVGLMMIEAHDAADDHAAVLVFGQPIHRAALMTWGQQRRVDR